MSHEADQDARRHLASARVALGNLARARVGDVGWKHALGHLGMAVERLRELGVGDEPAKAETVSDPDADPDPVPSAALAAWQCPGEVP